MGTVQHLGRDYRPTPDPVTANVAFFSCDKSIPGNFTDHLDFFFETKVTLDWNIVQFLSFILRGCMDKSFRLSRRRAKSAPWFKT